MEIIQYRIFIFIQRHITLNNYTKYLHYRPWYPLGHSKMEFREYDFLKILFVIKYIMHKKIVLYSKSRWKYYFDESFLPSNVIFPIIFCEGNEKSSILSILFFAIRSRFTSDIPANIYQVNKCCCFAIHIILHIYRINLIYWMMLTWKSVCTNSGKIRVLNV